MAFVVDAGFKIVSPGQTLTIWGGFFDARCSVYIGGKNAPVIEYDDAMIVVSVPSGYGAKDVVLNDGSKDIAVCQISVVELAQTPKRNAPKDYSENDFDVFTASLLPRGRALSMENGSVFRKLLKSISTAFRYVWGVIRETTNGIDPTHTENLSEWESELNLPVLGINPKSDSGRRSEIYRIECLTHGNTISDIRNLLSLMGIDGDVYEFYRHPEKFTGVEFFPDDPNYFYKIEFKINPSDISQFCAGSGCAGDYLTDFQQYETEQVFRDTKPAHTKIVFGYVVNAVRLVTDAGKVFVDDNNNQIVIK